MLLGSWSEDNHEVWRPCLTEPASIAAMRSWSSAADSRSAAAGGACCWRAGPPTWPRLSLVTLAGHKAGPVIRYRAVPAGPGTGTTTDLGVPLSVAGSGYDTQSMAWSPDSRWLFVAASGGRLVAVSTRTGRAEGLGVALPAIDQVAIRA
jgi:hypothetical protein